MTANTEAERCIIDALREQPSAVGRAILLIADAAERTARQELIENLLGGMCPRQPLADLSKISQARRVGLSLLV